jgi:RNA polymerase sigma factor (sigma-70 family)
MPFAQGLSEQPEHIRGTSRTSRHRLPGDVSGPGSSKTNSFLSENDCVTARYFALRPVSDGALEEEQTQQLLRSLADGNADAFWLLWDLYKGHLYHLCLWRMGGVRDDAEEALSRAMLRALNKLQSNGQQIRNPRAWLSKLTLNLCLDLHRERRRQVRRLLSIEDLGLRTGDLVPAVTDSPERAFLNREIIACLCDAVDDLPSRLRDPFVLRFFQEMAYPDIADCLILSTENVRKRIQQARGILKERLKRIRQVSPRTTRRNGGAAAAKRFTARSTVVEQAASPPLV